MNNYHCPYCSPHYQVHKRRQDGQMVCGQCGEQLVKVPLIKTTQIFAVVAAAGFIAPLILMIFSLFQAQNASHPEPLFLPITADLGFLIPEPTPPIRTPKPIPTLEPTPI